MKKLAILFIFLLCSCSHSKHFISIEQSENFVYHKQSVVVIPENFKELTPRIQFFQKVTEDMLADAGFRVLSTSDFFELKKTCIEEYKKKKTSEKCSAKNIPLLAFWNYSQHVDYNSNYYIDPYLSTVSEYETEDYYSSYALTLRQGYTVFFDSLFIIGSIDKSEVKEIISKTYPSLFFFGDVRGYVNCDNNNCLVSNE